MEYEDAEDNDSIERALPDLVLPDVESSDYEDGEVDAERQSLLSDSEYGDDEVDTGGRSSPSGSEYQDDEFDAERLSSPSGSEYEDDEVDAGRPSSPASSEYQDDEVDAGRLSVDAHSEYQGNEYAQEELLNGNVENEVAPPLPRRTRLPTAKYETEESRARRELIGLGMNYSARKYGFGWWLPDEFDFIRWRPNDEIAAHVASKATLWPGARSFKRRGGVASVDTGRHAQYLVDQLTEKNEDLLTTPHAVEQWRALLICIVIRQYDLFVWGRVWALSKRTKYWSFRKEAMRLYGPDSPPPYCFEVFRELFLVRGLPELPNILNGSSGKARSALQLIECLFDPIDPGSDQSGKKMTASTSAWMNSPYRALTKHCFDLVKTRSGEAAAKSWLRELHLAVALTHWILPAPTARGIFTICDKAGMRAKENRINWFSSIFTSYTHSGKEVPYGVDHYRDPKNGGSVSLIKRAAGMWNTFEIAIRSKYANEGGRLWTGSASRPHSTYLVLLLALARSSEKSTVGSLTTKADFDSKNTGLSCYTDQDTLYTICETSGRYPKPNTIYDQAEKTLRWVRGPNVVEMEQPPTLLEMEELKRNDNHVLDWFRKRLELLHEKHSQLAP
ncbi:hypothetical protein SEPCBS119000_006696, partial [Sporothrix epigloea]